MTIYANEGLTVDYRARRIDIKETGEQVALTPIQWMLLDFFIVNRRQALSKEDMAEHIDPLLTPNTVKWHVCNLRGKLGDAFPIHTVRGFGYRYDPA